MVCKEAVILAGGLGLRLRSVVRDVPKPMAPIGDKPFLEILIKNLIRWGVERIILAVGYKYEKIRDFFGENYSGVELIYSVETDPLGTGGAVLKAVRYINGASFFVLNGDTFFNINFDEFYRLHHAKRAVLSIALKYIKEAQRYELVKLSEENRIIGFEKRGEGKSGYINAGVYIIEKSFLLSISDELPEVFSFEYDLLKKFYNKADFYGFPFDAYFIDIGVPDDYERAQREIAGFGF